MKICPTCHKEAEDDARFCRFCGTALGNDAQPQTSRFLKYAAYLDDAGLYRVAVAKENGIIKEEYPGEAEDILRELSLRGHLDSMYRYANLLMNQTPPKKALARKWLSIAAEKQHVASINLLRVMDWKIADEKERGRAENNPYELTPLAPQQTENGRDVSRPRGDGILSGEQIYDSMADSVVEICAQRDHEAAFASGFCVSDNGFIVTNAHAVLEKNGEPYPTIFVKFRGEVYQAVAVAYGAPFDGTHNSVDLAVLFAPELQSGRAVRIGRSAACRNGQKVYLIGNSRGDGTCITSGIISDAKREIPGLSFPYLMTDAAANPGNSGGPLINEKGEVIGVLVAGTESAEGMNYAIPSDTLTEFLRYIISCAGFPPEAIRSFPAVLTEPQNMAINALTILSGVKLVADVITMIVNYIQSLKK